MPTKTRIVAPGPKPGTVRTEDGQILSAPENWELLPPGDAGVTRRVKKGGPSWTVKTKRGRRVFSQGVWAPSSRIHAARLALSMQRSTPQYAVRRAADTARRERVQKAYIQSFDQAIRTFLGFDGKYDSLAAKMARAVTEHATPVGSGTVARTQRIPVEERAERAVLAWMRHHTTNYDHTAVAWVKGARRALRRKLGKTSRRLLDRYRRGQDIAPDCPLHAALSKLDD